MFYIIAKPLKKKKASLHEEIKARLTEAGIPFEFHVTTRKGEGEELAARFSEAEDPTILVVGGDGTLNNVLCGMDPSRCTLGLIPAGTGNDFAAAAKIPYGIKALDLILGKEPQYTDYLAFSDGKRSLNIAGIGIDVDILERCERKKHFTARSKYFFSLVSALFHYRGAKMKIVENGRETEGKFLISVVCNGRQFGGGIPICPPAVIDDGKLELVYVDCPSRLRIPFALIKLMRGKLLSMRIAHSASCEEAELIPESPCVAQYDGELMKTEKLKVRIVHRELRMYRG